MISPLDRMNNETDQEEQYKINTIIKQMWEHLTIEGRSRVRDEKKHLSAPDLKEPATPEEFTKEKLIRRIIDLLKLDILPEKVFHWGKNVRRVDYRLKSSTGSLGVRTPFSTSI